MSWPEDVPGHDLHSSDITRSSANFSGRDIHKVSVPVYVPLTATITAELPERKESVGLIPVIGAADSCDIRHPADIAADTASLAPRKPVPILRVSVTVSGANRS
jgi:hypothetical protein